MPRKRAHREGYVAPSGWPVWAERGRVAAKLLLAGPLPPEELWAGINGSCGYAANVMAWLDQRGHTVYDEKRRLWRLTSGGARFAVQVPKVPQGPDGGGQPVSEKRPAKKRAKASICDGCGGPNWRPKSKTCSSRCAEQAWRRVADGSPLRSDRSKLLVKKRSARADGAV